MIFILFEFFFILFCTREREQKILKKKKSMRGSNVLSYFSRVLQFTKIVTRYPFYELSVSISTYNRMKFLLFSYLPKERSLFGRVDWSPYLLEKITPFPFILIPFPFEYRDKVFFTFILQSHGPILIFVYRRYSKRWF